MGVVSPIGNSVSEFTRNAMKGANGVGPITRFDPVNHRTKFACEVKDFDPEKYLDRNEIRRSDPYTRFSLHAAAQAVEDSGIDVSSVSPFDIGVIWGSGQGGIQTFEEEIRNYVTGDGTPRFSPFFIPKIIVNIAPGMIAMKHGFMGVNFATVSACASSNHAIMDAFHYIKMGKAKAIVAGGGEAAITEGVSGGFGSMKALSADNENYEKASRPFDESRNGFVMGEGAGALFLEEYEHAKKRGAHIYAEIGGVGATADAYHLSSSHPEGLGAARAMEMALEQAGVNTEEVDYLNAHATSTPVGDLSEIRAIVKVFGESPSNLVVGATKSMTGHLLGGAGAIESILSVAAIIEGHIPPTINTENIDPQIPNGIRISRKEGVVKEVKIALSNTFGFGGHNTSLLFKKPD